MNNEKTITNYGIIYKCINKINSKIYIGQTTKTLERRIKNHLKTAKRKPTTYFHKAIIKYGDENFDWIIIDECISKEELDKQEKYYIEFYNSINPNIGYNISSGGHFGNNFLGKTEEEKNIIKKKISDSRKGRFSGENHPLYGTHCSEETKEKMRNTQKGRSVPEERKIKISNSHKGKKISEEQKLKQSQTMKGRKFTEEHRKNISKARKELGLSAGKNNPNYGKKWKFINNGIIIKKVLEEKLEDFLNSGWILGRKFKIESEN